MEKSFSKKLLRLRFQTYSKFAENNPFYCRMVDRNPFWLFYNHVCVCVCFTFLPFKFERATTSTLTMRYDCYIIG